MAKKKSISRKRLEERLTQGEVKFSYEKLDGSVREVRGTTNVELIPEEWRPSGGTLAHSGTAYFDLDIEQWRSISAVVSKVSIL
jgi:predicted rRNA methylase YqxC with S4 and FtsJ domains